MSPLVHHMHTRSRASGEHITPPRSCSTRTGAMPLLVSSRHSPPPPCMRGTVWLNRDLADAGGVLRPAIPMSQLVKVQHGVPAPVYAQDVT